jgi:DNA-binding XRE family transcriptional regulator
MAQTKLKKRDLGLLKHARYIKGADNGPLARKIGAKIRETREKLGMSQETLAKHVGGNARWLEAVETGRTFPSQEACHRFVRVLWAKETWKDAPYKRGIGEKINAGTDVRITVFDAPFVERWQDFARETGCTLSAVARYALERLFDDSPTLVTIKEGIQVAEKLRAQSILESCPEYVTLLRGDPLAAVLVHTAPEANWKDVATRDGFKLGTEVLLARDPDPQEDVTRSGPAS